MMTSWNGNTSRVTHPLWGESIVYRYIPLNGTVMRRFDASFDVNLNKRLDKQSSYRWFETLWRTCTVMSYLSKADTIFEITLPPLPYHHSSKTCSHYSDVIMGAMVSQITSLTVVLLNRLFRRRSKKTSKLPVTGLCEAKWPVTRKMFPFDDVIMYCTQPL